MTLQGTVSQDLYAADVRAVALGKDGRTFWAELDAKGDFKLVVPTGQPYRIVLVRPESNGGNKLVAGVVANGALGQTAWLRADQAATIRLGTILPADVPAAATKVAGVKTAALGIRASGSGRGGTVEGSYEESSGRGGSGRGGSGRGGHEDAEADDDQDDYADDAAHDDDPKCQEADPVDDHVCRTEASKKAVCSRGAEYADYSEGYEAEAISPCSGTTAGGSDAGTAPEAPSDPTSPISP